MAPPVNHVIVLMLENRSFDHLLGFMQPQYPPGVLSGLSGNESNPDESGAEISVSNTAAAWLDVDPVHRHDGAMLQLTGRESPPPDAPLTSRGFVRSYAAATREAGHDVMRCFNPLHVPVITSLAKAFAVCDHWFCSVPGETWPNRNYVHAATSDGEVNIEKRFYRNRTIFEMLQDAGHEWSVYHRGPAQLWAFANLWQSPFSKRDRFRPLDQLSNDIAAGRLAAYTFVEPDHGLLWPKHRSNSEHPSNNKRDGRDFYQGEQLILDIYSALVSSPAVWSQSLFLITYDEHGGFYDHLPPPQRTAPAVAPDLKHHRDFAFDLLGPRVPTVLVSPWISAATVDATVYDHSAVPASLRERFASGSAPLTKRDDVSATFWHNLSRTTERPASELPDPIDLRRRLDAVMTLGASTSDSLTGPSVTSFPATAFPEPMGITNVEPGKATEFDDFQRSLLELTVDVDIALRTRVDAFAVDAGIAVVSQMAAQPLQINDTARIAYIEDVERRLRGNAGFLP